MPQALPTPPSARMLRAAAALALSLVLVLGWWLARGLPAANAALGAKNTPLSLPCVSYSPFRHPDINPFNYSASVARAQIEADLRVLQSVTSCVRTYGLSQGLDQVPSVVRQLGMRLKLGIWLSRDEGQNQVELDRGLALAKAYQDVVDLLVVGNEVLLRRELTAPQLALVLRKAKAQSSVPVSYADVWEFWQRNDSLAKDVDVVTVHILPYWEDNPVALSAAVAHVQSIATQMQQHFAPKPVWVGETGWPAEGRQRAAALPSVLGQSQFVHELAADSARMSVGFNLIEAFDQPWKRSFEGAMGGYWGLFDKHGQARATRSGAQVEDPLWWRGFAAALTGFLLGAGVAFANGLKFSGNSNSGLRLVLLALAAALLGTVAAVQLRASVLWDRTVFEAAVSTGLAVLGALACLMSVMQISLPQALPATRLKLWRWQFALPGLDGMAHAARIATLFAAASAALVLLLDPRYRPFPWWWFLAPAVAWWALRRAVPEVVPAPSARVKLLGYVLALCALGIALQEGWRNTQALVYGAVLLGLAWATLGSLPGLSRGTKTRADSKAAGAQSSAE
jgi:exo-beta-1,3-glucanase (GH17 family)